MSVFIYAHYSCDEEPASEIKVSSFSLDPILCAGVITRDIQKELADFTPFSRHAYRLINDQEFFVSHLIDPSSAQEPVPRSSWKRTKSCWRSHISGKHASLKSAGIVVETTKAFLTVSTYFAIAKSCSHLARSIFAGGKLSRLFIRPPSVNLPQLPLVLRIMAEIVPMGEGAYMLCSDVRHYFHEIAVGEDIQPFFTIFSCNQLLMFKTLVMGWSYSPRVAQRSFGDSQLRSGFFLWGIWPKGAADLRRQSLIKAKSFAVPSL